MVIKETKNNETKTYVSTVSHSAGWVGGRLGPGKRQTPMLAVSHYAPWLTSNPLCNPSIHPHPTPTTPPPHPHPHPESKLNWTASNTD